MDIARGDQTTTEGSHSKTEAEESAESSHYAPNNGIKKRKFDDLQETAAASTESARFVSFDVIRRMVKKASDHDVIDGTYGCVVGGVDEDGVSIVVKSSHYGKSMTNEDKLVYLETAMNEASIYAELQTRTSACPQILRLKYVALNIQRIMLVFERWPWDFSTLQASDTYLTLVDNIRMMLDVAKGLKYMHDRAIIHGDLKHNNVLARLCPTTGCWQACIMDMGLSMQLKSGKHVLRENHPYNEMSSYMPDDKYMSVSFDVYSFGVLLARVLVNDYKGYGRRDIATVMLNVLDTESVQRNLLVYLENNYNACGVLTGLARDCMAKAPEARPSMSHVCNVIAEQLESFS